MSCMCVCDFDFAFPGAPLSWPCGVGVGGHAGSSI